MGQSLSERLGQQFVIENRPGAAGNLATEAVVRALAIGAAGMPGRTMGTRYFRVYPTQCH